MVTFWRDLPGAAKVVLFLGVGGLLAFLGLVKFSDWNERKQAEVANAAAWRACQVAVSSQLKAPATAQFTKTSSGPGLVFGTVDAQNSFGALIRNSFVCQVSGAGESWKATATIASP